VKEDIDAIRDALWAIGQRVDSIEAQTKNEYVGPTHQCSGGAQCLCRRVESKDRGNEKTIEVQVFQKSEGGPVYSRIVERGADDQPETHTD
jgi:hypothetical protein